MDRLIFFLGSLMILTVGCINLERRCEHFGPNPGDRVVKEECVCNEVI